VSIDLLLYPEEFDHQSWFELYSTVFTVYTAMYTVKENPSAHPHSVIF
jgi:hypothetical protein